MTDLSIRAAQRAEHDQVVVVWKASWESIGISNASDDAVTTDMLRARLRDAVLAGHRLFVGVVDGRIVGMLLLDIRDNHLDQLFVAPDAQSQGIGKALLRLAREQMPDEIWLTVAANNTRARSWYEREGFRLEAVRRHETYDRDIAQYCWTLTEPSPAR